MAVAAVAGWFFFLRDGGTPVGPSNVAQNPPAAEGAATTPPSPGTTPDTVRMNAPVNPNPVPPRTVPVNTPGSTTPAGTNAGQLLATWQTRLEAIDMDSDSVSGARVARNALREIEPLLGTLSGIQLDDARYLAMLSYNALNDEESVCTTARQVKASRYLSTERKAVADLVTTGRGCQ